MDANNAEFSLDLLAPCGLYCGVCPQFTRSPKKCHGCRSGKGFSRIERGMCGIVKCCRNQHIERCNECAVYPQCPRLGEFATWDSFISHAPVIENLERVNALKDRFIPDLTARVLKGEYPPAPRPKSWSFKKLWHMMRPPFRPKSSS